MNTQTRTLITLLAVGLFLATPAQQRQADAAPEDGAADIAVEETVLAIGDPAPDFTLDGTGKSTTTLSDFNGISHVVLIFYPKDFTSVCTRQLCQLRDDYADFTAVDAVGFGINDNPSDSHTDFKTEYKMPFELLVDPGLEVAAAYGASREGQPFVDRTVVIVAKDQTIIFYARGVPSSAEMLTAITDWEAAQG